MDTSGTQSRKLCFSKQALLVAASIVVFCLNLPGCGKGFQGSLNEQSPGGPKPSSGQPVVSTVTPSSVMAGGPSFTITVTGTNFAPGDSVEWDDVPLNSTYISSTQMTATVPNQKINHAGTATIIVQTPTPYSLNFGTTITITTAPAPGTNGFTVSMVNILANDMVFDPVRQQIYLSVAGTDPGHPNTIVPLNPATGQIGMPVSAGTGANHLSISSDGSWLYAGIDKSGTVQRFALPTLSGDITVPLGTAPSGQQYYAVAVEAAPGSPNTIAISRATVSNSDPGNIAIFDGATIRPVTISSVDGRIEPLWSVAWNTNGTALFGAFNQLYIDPIVFLSVDSSGAQFVRASSPVDINSIRYSSSTGDVYDNIGRVFDPSTMGQINQLPLNAAIPIASSLLVLDDNLSMAWVLAQAANGQGAQFIVEGFDLKTNALLGAIYLPSMTDTPVKLIRWGTNGLAVLTNGPHGPQTGDGVYLINGAFVTNPSIQSKIGTNPAF